MSHGYFVALFDILGFEERLNKLGLNGMLERYEALIDVVNYRKIQIEHAFGKLGFAEAPYWISDGDVFIFSEIYGAYASDSILLWSNRTWPDARKASTEESLAGMNKPADAWKYHPIPGDNFFDVCNDLMCRALEVGLPLRGAISIGEAVLDQSRGIFLGKPVIEAARMENGQRLIGSSFCISTAKEIIPQRYKLESHSHIKETHQSLHSGFMLDWPRHWRNTRKYPIEAVIRGLNVDPRFSSYYENTLDFLNLSKSFSDKFESTEEKTVRYQYPQFSWSNKELEVNVKAIRRIRIDGGFNTQSPKVE